jgi:hypothetical protein
VTLTFNQGPTTLTVGKFSVQFHDVYESVSGDVDDVAAELDRLAEDSPSDPGKLWARAMADKIRSLPRTDKVDLADVSIPEPDGWP